MHTRNRSGFWYLLPAAALFVLFAIGPMAYGIYVSFLKWNGLTAPLWVGLANWARFFRDPVALHSLTLTIYVMLLSWVVQTPLSMALGIYLAGKQKHRQVIAVGYFLPLLFSSVAIALVWSSILNPNFGLLDNLLNAVGLSSLALDWLGSTRLALPVLIAIVSWQYIPFHTLLYQAGAQQIPASLYEAAHLDGASPGQRFLHITLPQLRYTLVTSSVLILSGSLTFFDLIYILTGGGPGHATQVLTLMMYQKAFQSQNLGYGSMIGVLLALIGLALTLVTLRFSGFRRMESQAEGAA
jgi:raffinose/stachyose/melibiose transport system permease protein